MKKYISILLSVLILFTITGCKSSISNSFNNENEYSTLTCSKEEVDEDGNTTSEKVTVTYKDNIVTKTSSESIIEIDPDYMELSLAIADGVAEKYNEVSGFTYKVNKVSDSSYKVITSVDYDNLDVDQLRNVASDIGIESDEINTKMTLDEYKENNLNDYVCK